MKKQLLIILFVLAGFMSNAQPPNDTLRALLEGKRNYKEIEETVLRFYANRSRGKGSGYNPWLRWLWFNRDRTDSNGNIVNVKELTANAFDALNNSPLGNAGAGASGRMSNWTNLGPTNYSPLTNSYLQGLGRVDRIAFHPTDPNIIYIGTPAGGLWGTTNGGTSWSPLSDEIFTTGISGIICDYSNPNTLYILTGEGEGSFGYFNYMSAIETRGVYKSTDAGTTWTKMANFPNPTFLGYQLIQHPSKPNVIYAATNSGIYTSVTGGSRWYRSLAGQFRDLVLHPAHPDIMYVDQGISLVPYLVTNDSTFTSLSANVTGTNSGSYVAMAVSPNEPNTIMLLASKSNPDGDDFQGLYKGTFVYNGVDPTLSTLSFSTIRTTPNILGGDVNGATAGGQSWYDMCIALKPNDASKLITGGLCVWKGTNYGNTMSASTTYDRGHPTIAWIHPDIHRVVYNPLNNILYALSDGGIYRSTDDGTTWTDLSVGLSIAQYYSISGTEANANLILGGTQDNGTFFRKTTSSTFSHVRGADGYSTAINPLNSNEIYWTENQSVFKSTDGGSTVNGLYTFSVTTFNAGVFPELRMHKSNPDTIIVFNKNSAVMTKNGGTTWNSISGTMFPNIRDIKFGFGSSTKGYYTSDLSPDSFFVCNNIYTASPVWTAKKVPAASLTRIEIEDSDPNKVWLGKSSFSSTNLVVFSPDGGTTWQDMTGSLPIIAINCIETDNYGNVYIGTDVGVFFRRPGDTDWSPFYNGLPKLPVTSLLVNNTSGLLRASTLGRGIWSTNYFPLSSYCPLTDNITGTIFGNNTFQAVDVVTSTATISGSSGNNVHYRAGVQVTWSPGFLAAKGSLVTAKIGPCFNGSLPTRPAENNTASAAKKNK